MKKDWSNYGLVAALPLLFVIVVYSTLLDSLGNAALLSFLLAICEAQSAFVIHRHAQFLVGSSTWEADQEAELKQYGLNLSSGPVGELFFGNFFQ